MLKKVAIFDIDGTIFRSSLLIELVEVMIERELFNPALRKKYEREQKAWQDREGTSQQGDYQMYLGKVVEVFVENIKGIAYADFQSAVDVVMERHRHRTYRYTRDLVGELKAKGYFLLAISQSPKGILDEFCKQYGFGLENREAVHLTTIGRIAGDRASSHDSFTLNYETPNSP